MKTENIKLVYFSATNTTQKIVRHISTQLDGDIKEYNITRQAPEAEVVLDNSDLLIVGMPVYAGRIPAITLPALHQFKGNGTPAIIVCVYGNREYDDALLELKDVVEANGFKVVSAGAFIAQHSIFPQVGTERPDKKDMESITEFAQKSKQIIDSIDGLDTLHEIIPKGNRPYKVPGKLPLQPSGNRKCTACGTCVKQCPAQAIAADTPRKTDKEKCIACGRCIVVCPADARHFGGLLYKVAGRKFVKAHSARKDPEFYF
ncbi:ferredoxin [Parabacteroides sp. PF5-5]|uniref:EFR1 family ferrodoxin n=1 Tax=unclassified Parabacteroides TaxID=2649774 RepID=UPI0024752C57|nr:MULTISPECIES: EFR1 family ferrodoxin [unclassified Parabacteroides]MDH6305169.1 ferredoxin [Parabacteroides sp. PH5-39]MDH6316519.1 ferredoxin [Parabacteroides sp. PF5-13]MDH6320029.1 ferredoxin [Parabacteroides sp. PH5-13]MDH6323738.1 ferredoxin [Parabacteroides sp. PH5-8]MDH6327706.1 ferredoxin [Parabacteroides sp. PH5-41]